ncbi:hypothetical protein OC835_005930 [Tilletia horrida]|uniref:Peptidase A1 domain-containing protein n=1 Tax=Tilletia horrida TaxID=155126 RepID=A0AAN6G9I6_9BASI|nr:hypothetical protein OC835_005930 [Tilletia horrida]KAK0528536.1 hypothetical protein OC842_004528 [Tilletia horrida]
MGILAKLTQSFKSKRNSIVAAKPAHAAPAAPVTVVLRKRSPHTVTGKVAAAVEGTVAAVSEKEAYALASAYVSRVRVKYHRHFDAFEANVGKKNGFDNRTVETTEAAAAVAGSGNEPLTDQQNELLWTGEVQVGTPAQTIVLDFDTGSSDTWVNPNIYKPSASSTAKKTGKTFRVAYGDGSNASGDIYKESVTVGGLTALNQAFGNATKSTLQDSGNQGIAGLAFESIAQFKSPPFFDTLVAQGTVPSPVFSFGLWPEGARLDLGQIVAEAYQGDIVYSPVDPSDGFWTTSFNVTGVDATQTGIIDTGTTLIIGPPDVVTAIYQSLGVQTQTQQGEVYGVYPTNSPPSISLTFNGVPFTISPDALSFQSQGTQTIAGLIGADIGAGPAWIVGDVFLQDVYAVFDKSPNAPQVGFAPKATSSVPSTSGAGATQTTDGATATTA